MDFYLQEEPGSVPNGPFGSIFWLVLFAYLITSGLIGYFWLLYLSWTWYTMLNPPWVGLYSWAKADCFEIVTNFFCRELLKWQGHQPHLDQGLLWMARRAVHCAPKVNSLQSFKFSVHEIPLELNVSIFNAGHEDELPDQLVEHIPQLPALQNDAGTFIRCPTCFFGFISLHAWASTIPLSSILSSGILYQTVVLVGLEPLILVLEHGGEACNLIQCQTCIFFQSSFFVQAQNVQ